MKICVKEVKGRCSFGYKPEDCFAVERFYLSDIGKRLRIHIFASMHTLLMPFLKDVSAKSLGVLRILKV